MNGVVAVNTTMGHESRHVLLAPVADAVLAVRKLVDEASRATRVSGDDSRPTHASSATTTQGSGAFTTEPVAVSNHALIEAIGQIEQMKNALDAAQARLEVHLRSVRVQAERAAGIPAAKAGSGVGHEIGLARRISPASAGNQLSLRRVLVESMPRTVALLEQGEISGWAAEEVARAVLVLDDEERDTVDAEIAPRLPDLTSRGAGRVARGIADRLNAEAAVARIRRNTALRTVTQRAAGEGMMRLSALLPTHEGVAAYVALTQAAGSAKAQGDERSRGAVMADTLVQRVTGVGEGEIIPVEIQLLMTDATLLAGGNDVALIDGHPIPGPVARNLALTGSLLPDPPASPVVRPSAVPEESCPDADPGKRRPGIDEDRTEPRASRWLRRLYTDPVSGDLTAIDARRRAFTGHVRAFITARDQRCRGPWCDAPIRHVHHAQGYADGGGTTPENGVGTCERLNQVAELPGWSTRSSSGEGGTGDLTITTPSCHRYTSRPPRLQEELCVAPTRRRSEAAMSGTRPAETGSSIRVEPEILVRDADGTRVTDPPEDWWIPPPEVMQEWFVPEYWIPVEDLEPL